MRVNYDGILTHGFGQDGDAFEGAMIRGFEREPLSGKGSSSLAQNNAPKNNSKTSTGKLVNRKERKERRDKNPHALPPSLRSLLLSIRVIRVIRG